MFEYEVITNPSTNPSPAEVRSNCPDCAAPLAILRVIPGRARCEYWTLRCTHCGGIHLDIIKPTSTAAEQPA